MTNDVLNYVNGEWRKPAVAARDVIDPATQEVIGCVPLSGADEVAQAVDAAQAALPGWRNTPPGDRVQYLYRLKTLLETHKDELATLITRECGKTFEESRAELSRAIEDVEVACGIPSMLQGRISEDIAPGIDESVLFQPVGVSAIITPFNFPGMIPFWFLPYALACGNPVVVKPSERVPLTMQRAFELMESLDMPKGVINLVNGAKEAVDGLLDHPSVRAVSFVGSTGVARYIYSRGSANGKRVQAQGGAKNPVVIMPDADLSMTTRIVADSAFGCAGQRCLAASLAITVGEIGPAFREAIAQDARERRIGYGLDPSVQMGPVISHESRERIEALVTRAVAGGASLLADGRGYSASGYENGSFTGPTVLDNLPHDSEVHRTEIFGPVLGLFHVDTLDEAIHLANDTPYGNMACIFTNSGSAARKFRHDIQAGNVGVNIGVAAPMAFFPFSGWKDSFFGDLHAQAMDGVEFYTQKKVVIERWPKEWSRKF